MQPDRGAPAALQIGCAMLAAISQWRAPPRLREVLIETLCFHAQQAAEKAIKAALIAKGIAPPHTHNIGILLDRLPPGVVVPFGLDEAAALTDFAVTARYPGEHEPIAAEEYREAIQLAETIVLWAEAVIRT